ncbi:MAG: phosphoenolpyruvate--protein phosphotransferase [Proteobacteria bacterium]|nr:phosphoenolpyruvate--protein phosphotransferase [Pseudomonadota bacterium]MCH8056243.1 phosphoenolpyruvate--protein phosphotransferase [Pseudomonadota bacterium]
MTLALTGHAVASGIAIGQTHLAERNELEIEEYRIEREDVKKEITRYHQAVDAARNQLDELAQRISRNVGIPAGEIIQIHVLMLGDDSIREATENQIRSELCNAEWALQSQLELILCQFRIMDDPYIRSRGEDITQVVRLVQSKLNEKGAGKPLENIPDRLAETMVIATELTPDELAILHERGVAGIVTEHGGPHSHTAILASSLGIPAVFGVRLAQSLLKEGETLVLDGDLGVVYADPDVAILDHYHQVQRDTVRFRKSLEKVRKLPCRSIDGESISLQANGERPEELLQAIDLGVTGIGLYRTEFLHHRGMASDEETQLGEYLAAIETLKGLPLTIRTLDLGADKPTDSADYDQPSRSANPALGLRAVRLCLRDTDQFKMQLRAILRASAAGPVSCLIPMLTSAPEVVMVRTLLDEAREELDESGLAYDPNLPLGGMIEVPAAALSIEEFSQNLDFISVGTNDLLQFMLAADRADEEVAHLYDLQHPGMVRLLRHIFRTAEASRIPVSLCGEVAGDRRYTRLLLALGLREFSMHPSRLLEVKQVITETHIPRATAALTQWLNNTGNQRDISLLQLLDQSQQTLLGQ